MFIVKSSNWPYSEAPGQERLLIELWLEAVASDTSAPYRPAICSTHQTLKNLLMTLSEVDRKVLYEYHIKDSAEEALHFLNDCGWLKQHYADDISILRELLVKLRDSHQMEDAGTEEKRRDADQADLRMTASSFLNAFLAKVQQSNPVEKQVSHIRELATNKTTNFEVLSRAVEELTNDLVHMGHSRDHLHAWMISMVLKPNKSKPQASKPVLERFDEAKGLGKMLVGGYQVLFMVSTSNEVPDSEGIRFVDVVPANFDLPSTSPFSATKKRFAVVDMPNTFDRRAASEQAYRHLMRYLHSTRLDHLEFERTVTKRSAVLTIATGNTLELPNKPGLISCELYNDERFYAMGSVERNSSTFAELDRVLYWLEQARRWDDIGHLIALWTALEFLFSKTTRPAAESIQDYLPAYLVPNYARELLVDLWSFIEHVPDIKLTPEMESRLNVQPASKGKRRKVDLVKLLELCLEADADNPLRLIIQDYPILLRKYYRVRRLNPASKEESKSCTKIWNDLSRFEQELTFDLRYAYRARNTIVHDAALQIIQIDRLIQRLNWMLCTVLDTLLYQFVLNPKLSLTELHAINKHNYGRWKQQLKGNKPSMPLAEIVDPPQHCLAGRTGR